MGWLLQLALVLTALLYLKREREEVTYEHIFLKSTKKKARCDVCNTVIATAGNTTNMAKVSNNDTLLVFSYCYIIQHIAFRNVP